MDRKKRMKDPLSLMLKRESSLFWMLLMVEEINDASYNHIKIGTLIKTLRPKTKIPQGLKKYNMGQWSKA